VDTMQTILINEATGWEGPHFLMQLKNNE